MVIETPMNRFVKYNKVGNALALPAPGPKALVSRGRVVTQSCICKTKYLRVRIYHPHGMCMNAYRPQRDYSSWLFVELRDGKAGSRQ